MTENEIRDNLYEYLNEHFPHYIPVDKENYVKYDKQRAFIDILAKDNDGNYVVIELKKSNNAARQAIHEVIKYTEFVKKQYAVNDDEIKLVIISTEWDELIIPFSKFYFSHNMFDIQGIKLNVDNKGKYISHTIIEPMKINDERVFSPEHFNCYYNDLKSLGQGYNSFKDVMKSKKIDDYVLYTLKRPTDITYIHDFQYIIYFAMLRKSKEEYEEILEMIDTTGEVFSEVSLYRVTNDNLYPFERVLNIAHPIPESDSFFEKSKPNMFQALLNLGWEIIKVDKFGRLNNELFKDNDFIYDVLDLSGNGDVMFSINFNTSDKRKLNRVRKSVENILYNNPLFKNQFLNILRDIENEKKDISVEIFNPTNILLSIYQENILEDSTALPFFNIHIPEDKVLYLGTLLWDKKKDYSFDTILQDYYSQNLLDVDKGFVICSQRDHILMHNEIIEYLDLEYNTLKIYENNIEQYYNGVFKKITNPRTIKDFLEIEDKFCKDVEDEFKKYLKRF